MIGRHRAAVAEPPTAATPKQRLADINRRLEELPAEFARQRELRAQLLSRPSTSVPSLRAADERLADLNREAEMLSEQRKAVLAAYARDEALATRRHEARLAVARATLVDSIEPALREIRRLAGTVDAALSRYPSPDDIELPPIARAVVALGQEIDTVWIGDVFPAIRANAARAATLIESRRQ